MNTSVIITGQHFSLELAFESFDPTSSNFHGDQWIYIWDSKKPSELHVPMIFRSNISRSPPQPLQFLFHHDRLATLPPGRSPVELGLGEARMCCPQKRPCVT